jgi:hypothetical protein
VLVQRLFSRCRARVKLADFLGVFRLALWKAAYVRLVRSSFATVPFYREHWALSGRTDPILVSGKEGVNGGAVPAEMLAERLGDLVPLKGGRDTVEPLRDNGPDVLTDELLGVLARRRDCGHWHVDWTTMYVRSTPAGLAFSLLRQRSPRFVDVLPAGGLPGQVGWCRGPVLLT